MTGFEPATSAPPGDERSSADANESPDERETGESRATAGATETWQRLAELANRMTAAELELWLKVGESMQSSARLKATGGVPRGYNGKHGKPTVLMGMTMNRIAEELNAKMDSLDPTKAERLARMVRDAINAVDVPTPVDPNLGIENGWPVGYFAGTAGMFANEPFERGEQGVADAHESW